ncbi:MAG: cbb3-type cytochrome c oxidase subunit 3, partial [Ruminococcus sp.]|nr:cbb3-type cytochrome c oxidase subunit 3 [Ruminococcus sp.]
MKNIFSVIFMNLLGYDLLIFLTAIFTGVIYYALWQSASRLYDKMHLTVFVPDGGASKKEAEGDMSRLRETTVVHMRNQTGKL